MSWINKELLAPLLAQHGYNILNTEQDVPDEMLALFVVNIESQIREALRVALVSADNQGRNELQKVDMEAVLKQCKMFPGR